MQLGMISYTESDGNWGQVKVRGLATRCTAGKFRLRHLEEKRPPSRYGQRARGKQDDGKPNTVNRSRSIDARGSCGVFEVPSSHLKASSSSSPHPAQAARV